MTFPKTTEKMEELKIKIKLDKADMEIALYGIERYSKRLKQLIELKAPYTIVKRETVMIQYWALQVLSMYEAFTLLKSIYKDDSPGPAEELEVEESKSVRTCRVCGCTDYQACPGGCHWVEDDLCSSCVPKEDGEPCQQ